MQHVTNPKKAPKKLFLAGGAIALLVAGFFIYKYAYIHLERRKYDQATVAINKVAADLRAQGIETTFSKGCQQAEGVFGAGATSCSVGITYRGKSSDTSQGKNLESFIKYMQSNNFSLQQENGLTTTDNPIKTATSTYILKEDDIKCRLGFSRYGDNDELYNIRLACGSNSRYALF